MGRQWHSVLIASLLIFVTCADPAHAHAFKEDGGFYELFITGNKAVLFDLPIGIGLLAAAVLVGQWNAEGLVKVWPFFLAGNIAGFALCAAGMPNPIFIQFGLALLCGLGAAAALSLPVVWMRALAIVIGAVPVVAMLFDHHLGDVPIAFMVGVMFGLNLVFAAASSLVMMTLERLPYSWVRIAWRAIAAWTVAITMMMLALEISALQGEPEDLPGTTEQE